MYFLYFLYHNDYYSVQYIVPYDGNVPDKVYKMLMPIEKKIIKALEKRGNLTTRDLMKESGVGHSTFYKWVKLLEIDHNLVTHYKIKNEVHYMLKKPNEMSMEELDEFDKKSFENIELVIKSVLSKSKKKGSVE